MLWADILLAWAALILSFFAALIWLLRIVVRKKRPRALLVIYASLRKRHMLIGYLLIASGLAHGLVSSESILSLGWGTACWIFSVLLGLSCIISGRLKSNAWKHCHRVLCAAFTALIVIHIIDVGGFIIGDMITGKEQRPRRQAVEVAKLKDGVYEGTADGYRPGIVVEVVIEGGRITGVEVTRHNERDRMFWGAPVEMIPEAIIDAQSADVDIISGATKTCEGIMNAVSDALEKAAE